MSDVAVATTPSMPQREQPYAIPMRDFKEAIYANARFSAYLPVGVKYEDALKPEFWAQVCHLLHKTPLTNEPDRAGAIIELRSQDHEFYAELYVKAVQERGLVVVPICEPVYLGLRAVDSVRDDRWPVGCGGLCWP